MSCLRSITENLSLLRNYWTLVFSVIVVKSCPTIKHRTRPRGEGGIGINLDLTMKVGVRAIVTHDPLVAETMEEHLTMATTAGKIFTTVCAITANIGTQMLVVVQSRLCKKANVFHLLLGKRIEKTETIVKLGTAFLPQRR